MPSPVAFQQPYLSVFFATVAVWVASDYLIGRRYNPESDGTQDRGSKRAIAGATAVGVTFASLAMELVPTARVPYPYLVFWLGIVTILLGVAIRRYAVWTLGRYFSITVTVDSTDDVVDVGPYRWVRHPSYTGGLLSLVGLGIAVGNWLSFLIILLPGLVGYGYRISVEERALREELGDDYRNYATETPYRLVPKIW
ncbi:methyltransferase family protein [Haladaptatus cibarius]|uniref:methyltransferase family protein n=1 Tax=Haladaptatus cibarius TaxID=453847 RepID=UPI0006790AAA|nr:isoprenylcysteine carboxylmethyltransferase family protein [Haladaptatus cibarius]